jgi:hypothetical protein
MILVLNFANYIKMTSLWCKSPIDDLEGEFGAACRYSGLRSYFSVAARISAFGAVSRKIQSLLMGSISIICRTSGTTFVLLQEIEAIPNLRDL